LWLAKLHAENRTDAVLIALASRHRRPAIEAINPWYGYTTVTCLMIAA